MKQLLLSTTFSTVLFVLTLNYAAAQVQDAAKCGAGREACQTKCSNHEALDEKYSCQADCEAEAKACLSAVIATAKEKAQELKEKAAAQRKN